MSPFSIEYIAFHIGSYPLSLIELLGTLAGLFSVYWAARANIWTWPSGLVNIFFFFLIFYQTQLYSDMFLQLFFLVTTVYGWRNWVKKDAETEGIAIGQLTQRESYLHLLVLVVASLLWGLLMSNIHLLLPALFPQAAALPYPDACIAIASVLATFLLARKKWESWLLWVLVDALSVGVYFYKGLYVIGVEYIIFFFIAAYGLYSWRRAKVDAEG